jgi:DNA-binding cell septation regulator SpoVG
MSAKILKMNIVNFGKTRAFFTVAIDGYEIEGMKLVEGTKGFFVGMPSRSYKDPKDGTTKYVDIVKVTSKATYGEIVEAAKAEFARREGTLPVSASTVSLDDEDDTEEFPF